MEQELKEKIKQQALFNIKNTVGYHESANKRDYERICDNAIGYAIIAFDKLTNFEYLEKKIKLLREYQYIRSKLDSETPHTNDWYLLKAKEIETYYNL